MSNSILAQSPGGWGWGGGTLIFSYIVGSGHFWGFKISNINIFWGFQKNKYFFGVQWRYRFLIQPL